MTMNLKASLFLVSFLLKLFQANSHNLSEYYECLKLRNSKITNNNNRFAIICESGDFCILNSINCRTEYPGLDQAKSNWKKITYYPILAEYNVLENKTNQHFYFDKKTNNLIITDASKSDEGYYSEIIYDKTLISEYHVTVLDEITRYPVYEQNTQNLNSIILNSNIEKYIEWSEWGKCVCSSKTKNNIQSYRTRNGDCYLRIEDNIKNFNITLDIVGVYSNKVPCLSLLIPEEFKLKNYIMYGDCKADCSNRIDLSKKIQKNLGLNFYHLVETELYKNLRLKCDPKKRGKDLLNSSVFWNFGENWLSNQNNLTHLNDRIFMDKSNRLHLKQITFAEQGNFSCYIDGRLAYSYYIKIDSKIPQKFHFNFSYSSVLFIFIALIIVIVLSCQSSRLFF